MNDKLLTVDQAAAKLSVHPKTIRQYIRNRQLKAQKIGKLWRIQEKDLNEFIGNIPEQKTEKREIREKVTVSTVIDITVNDSEEAIRYANSTVAVLNTKDPGYGEVRFDHIYYPEENKVRLIFWGDIAFIGNMLLLIARISQ